MKCNYAREKFVRIYIDIYSIFRAVRAIAILQITSERDTKGKDVLEENELEMNSNIEKSNSHALAHRL